MKRRIQTSQRNGGVEGRDGSAEELDRETGAEKTTVDRTPKKDGGREGPWDYSVIFMDLINAMVEFRH